MSEVKTTYWGLLHVDENGEEQSRIRSIFTHPTITKMCGGKGDILAELELAETTEDPAEDDYWGWLDTDGNHYSMIYPREILLDVCFPYGKQVEIDRGDGRVVRLRIEICNRTVIS